MLFGWLIQKTNIIATKFGNPQTVNTLATMDNKNKTHSELVNKIAELESEIQVLKEQKELLVNTSDLIIWGTNTAIWEWNYKTGKVIFSDKKAEMLGYQHSELNPDVNTFTSMIHPDDYNFAMENMRNHLHGKTDFYEVEYRIKAKTGQWRWFYDKGKVVERDTENKPLRILGIVNDITEKKNALISLSESRQRFKNLFKYNYDGIRIVDANGIVIDVNERMCEITGYPADNTIGKFIWDIVFRHTPPQKQTPETYQRIKDITEKTLKFGKFPFIHQPSENELLCANGNIKMVETLYFAVPLNEGYLLYTIIHDITEKRQNEKQLLNAIQIAHENENKYRLIAENTSDGIFIADNTGKILYASPVYVKQLGFSEQDNLAANPEKIYEAIHPDDRDNVFAEVYNAIRNKAPELTYTFRAKHKQGYYIWREDHAKFNYDPNGNHINTYVICRNITQRKEAELEIRKLHKAIESLKTAIVITDVNGVIEYANPHFTLLTGFTPEEYLGKDFSLLRTDYQTADFYNQFWNVIKSGNSWEGEFYNRKKNGEHYWEHSIISPVLNEKNEISHYVAIKTDISENKKISSELVTAKEKAEESDKLKTAFLNNISHEIRTPLNAISGFSKIIAGKYSSDDKLNKYTKIISESSNKLVDIITDVIEISEIHANQMVVKKAEFDLVSLIHEIEAFYTPLMQLKNLLFLVNREPYYTAFLIFSDRYKISKILKLLIDNALKFTFQGTVTLDIKIISDKLNFTISDTGIGISKSMLNAIFEPFRQVEVETSRNYGGNGVGLSLVKGFVTLLNGTIIATSKLNSGTEFYITLPLETNNKQT